MEKSLYGVLLALGVTVMVTGCATTQYSGYAVGTKADAEAVDRGEYNNAAMAQIVVWVNTLIGVTEVPQEAMTLIQRAALDCQWQIDPQLAGPVQSGVNGGVPYAIAGAGIGPAMALGFGQAVVNVGKYALYGSGAYLLPGAANGLVTGSYAQVAAKGDCAKTNWEEYVKREPKYAGIHIGVAYAGKAWGNSAPPAYHPKKHEPASKGATDDPFAPK